MLEWILNTSLLLIKCLCGNLSRQLAKKKKNKLEQAVKFAKG